MKTDFIKELIELKRFSHTAYFNCNKCHESLKSSKIILCTTSIYYDLFIFTFCENKYCYNPNDYGFSISMNIKNIESISEEEHQLFINLYDKAMKALLLT
jgi:hypothetical protein